MPVAAAACLQTAFERREEVGRLRLLALLNEIMIRASKVSEGSVLSRACGSQTMTELRNGTGGVGCRCQNGTDLAARPVHFLL